MQPAQHVCPRCGAPIQPGQVTCSNCGLGLDPQSIAAWQAAQGPSGVQVAPAPPAARPTSRLRLFAILGGVFVLLCGGLLIFGAFTANSPEYRAGQTATAQSQAQAAQVAAAQTATRAALPTATTPPAPATTPPAPATHTAPPAAPTNTSAPPTNTAKPAPPTNTAVPPTASLAAVGKVGEPQSAGGMALTVNKVSTAASVNDFLKPKAGNVYLVTDVTIQNVTHDTAPYNPLYFTVKDADAFEYDPILLAPEPDLKSGDLAKGEKARGNVAFEVPKTAKGFVLTYKPLVLFGDFQPIQVDLGR